MTNAERQQARTRLLAGAGWAEAEARPLAGDASLRSYQRLYLNGASRVLMDAPPPQEDVRPFVQMAGWLRDQGLSAPELYAVDDQAGYILLEDLGDDLYSRVMAQTTGTLVDEGQLYNAAIDVLAAWQAQSAPLGIPDYDDDFLILEASYYVDWYVRKHLARPVSDDQRSEFLTAWRELFQDINPGGRVLVLRDYHADNLLWLPDREGLARVGLLDFQGALNGSVAYDLVSLARDVRRDVSDDMVECMIRHYLDVTGRTGFDEETFRTVFAIAGAQRNTKIAGLFVRLAQQGGKAQYLDYLPKVIAMLKKDLAHPRLAKIAAMMAIFEGEQ